MWSPREISESYWAAECRRDIEGVMAHYHPDAMYEDAGGLRRGHAEIRQAYEASARAYPGLEVTIVREYVADPDRSGLEFDAVLIDPADTRFRVRGVNVVVVRDGKFVSVRSYEDPPRPELPTHPHRSTLRSIVMTMQPDQDPRTPRGPVLRSYGTTFERDESPISEDGLWLNGRTDGIDWADVVTERGLAHGGEVRMGVAEQRAEQGNLGEADAAPLGDYDDPTAVLTGSWGPNQHLRATVFSRNQTDDYFQEVELRLRSSITAHSCTGYEVFWRCLKNENAYAEIVRWNGPIAGFTSLARRTGPDCGVTDGDVVEATIVGNRITSFINGVEVLTATDDRFANGSPGMGFNFGCGDTYVDHGFTSWEALTYDD